MTTREPSTHRTHDAAWSFHLPCGRCGSTSEDMECVPASPERDRPTCGALADRTRFVRCTKAAGHTGDRHTAELPGGSHTWGYAPTTEESA